MSLLSSTFGQLELTSKKEYKQWKQSLIETRGTDVFSNDLGVCIVDVYAATGFFPITQYKAMVETQLGLFAYSLYKFLPDFHKDISFVQTLELENTANITVDYYRVKNDINLKQQLLDRFSLRFSEVEDGFSKVEASYIIGTMSYQYIPEPDESPGSHSVIIVYCKEEHTLEIIDLNELALDEFNKFDTYIKRHVNPRGIIEISFSKQQSVANLPTSFVKSIDMSAIHKSLRTITPFSQHSYDITHSYDAQHSYAPPHSYEVISDAYKKLQEENDINEILELKTKLNNFLIGLYGSLAVAYPLLQEPKFATIKTYPKRPAVEYF